MLAKLGHAGCDGRGTVPPTVPKGVSGAPGNGHVAMGPSVFLSYRRDASSGSAGRVFDQLQRHLPQSQIFMDVDSIEPGVDFVDAIDRQIKVCDYFLAVVGPSWADARDAAGQRRLDNPNDYVRLEIEAALRRDIRVVPILVDGAKMPAPDRLPESLGAFTRRNAFEVSHHSFGNDVQELARIILKSLGMPPATKESISGSAPPQSWADILLQFRGRISRGQFWLWNLIVLAVCLPIQFAVIYAIQGELFLTAPDTNSFKANAISQIAMLPFYWMSFALVAKRLQDINAGKGILFSIAMLCALLLLGSLLSTSPMTAGTDEVSSAGRMALGGLLFGLFLCSMFIWCVVGAIPGTPGANRYGPDPLEAKQAKN